MDAPLVTCTIKTRKPHKYVLVDTETNDAWTPDEDGHWGRTPDDLREFAATVLREGR